MKTAVKRTLIGLTLVILVSAAPAQAAGPVREPGPIGRMYTRIIKIIKNVFPAPNESITIPKP